MAKNFNPDFYVTCATVIPVLYLALVVQGSTYQAMLRRAVHAAHTRSRRAALRPLGAYLVVAAGALGEVFALVALFMGSDTESMRVSVLIMTLIMVAVAGAGPTFRWWRAVSEALIETQRGGPPPAAGVGHGQPGAGSEQQSQTDTDESGPPRT